MDPNEPIPQPKKEGYSQDKDEEQLQQFEQKPQEGEHKKAYTNDQIVPYSADVLAKKKLWTELIEERQKKKYHVHELSSDRKKIKYLESLVKAHPYWDKMPTLRDDKVQNIFGNIEGKREVKDVRKEPLPLPSDSYSWCEIDLMDIKQLDEFYTLLTNNYVEDDDNTFRFDYSRNFLKWALTPPGFQPKWLVAIRDQKGEMIACITGIPVHTLVESDSIKMAEINFLCVHKQHRSQNLAPLLISEVTRRVNLKNKWQAIYTSGKTLPTPFARAVYYHRSLNPKKLIDIKFSGLGQNQTMAMVKKLYGLQEGPNHPFRPMNKKDVPSLTKLINYGLYKYTVKFLFSEYDVRHFFLPRYYIVYTYVLESDKSEGGKDPVITDMLSFYSLPSHVMNNPKHNRLNACYSFYNFATTISFTYLIKDALILAKRLDFDVYNCLNLMDNSQVFEDLFFQVGDGNLNYYFFNWIMKSKKIEPKDLAVVLF